jgi:hypothetical protein
MSIPWDVDFPPYRPLSFAVVGGKDPSRVLSMDSCMSSCGRSILFRLTFDFSYLFFVGGVPILGSFSLIHRLLNDVQRLERPEAVPEGVDVPRGRGTISCNSTRMILLGCK